MIVIDKMGSLIVLLLMSKLGLLHDHVGPESSERRFLSHETTEICTDAWFGSRIPSDICVCAEVSSMCSTVPPVLNA